MSDRPLRELIRVLRRSGLPIINLGKGYKFAETNEELERFKRQEFSRANDVIATMNAMHLTPDMQESLFEEVMLWAE